MKNYNVKKLNAFIQNVFKKIGFHEDDASIISDVLIAAELRGIPSHGIIRIPDYIRLVECNRLNPKANISITKETIATAVIDADKAAGMVAADKAMKLTIQKAQKTGVAITVVNNSNHYGIAGYYAMQALKHNMIGISLTNANPSVAPTRSIENLLGTNPIAVAIPAGNYEPFVLDMATTPVARGKIAVYEKKQEMIPYGWVQDKDGNPTNDPSEIKRGGCLVPLGGDELHSSYKGYGLAAVVDILSGILSGSCFGPWVPPIAAYMPLIETKYGKGTGHFFCAINIEAFRDINEFKNEMDVFINKLKSSKTANENLKVLIPGEPEKHYEKKYIEEGIPAIEAVDTELKKIADHLGINYDVFN